MSSADAQHVLFAISTINIKPYQILSETYQPIAWLQKWSKNSKQFSQAVFLDQSIKIDICSYAQPHEHYISMKRCKGVILHLCSIFGSLKLTLYHFKCNFFSFCNFSKRDCLNVFLPVFIFNQCRKTSWPSTFSQKPWKTTQWHSKTWNAVCVSWKSTRFSFFTV